MAMRGWTLLVPVLLVAGCGAPATVRVTGTLRMIGGLSPASGFAVPGHVVFAASGKRVSTLATSSGAFTVDLPSGRYSVTGTSPLYGSGKGLCRARKDVVVTNKGISGLVVVCDMR
ncbi:MAG: hypothetical protein JWP14_550 [Frankiales bacterium]|nr:hypothetical protein [Frankiales bacterium]